MRNGSIPADTAGEPRRRRWVLGAGALALVSLAACHPDLSPTEKEARAGARPRYSQTAGIALVTGLTRSQDGLSFGEWARDRMLRSRCRYIPATLAFFAQDQPIGWYVYIGIIPTTKIPPGYCPTSEGLRFLAIVRHDNGVLLPIHPEGEHEFVFNFEKRIDYPPSVPPGASWLEQFQRGDPP